MSHLAFPQQAKQLGLASCQGPGNAAERAKSYQGIVGGGVGAAAAVAEVLEGGKRGAPAAGGAGGGDEGADGEAVRRMAVAAHLGGQTQRLLVLAGLAARADQNVERHRRRLHIPVRFCTIITHALRGHVTNRECTEDGWRVRYTWKRGSARLFKK